MRSRARKLKQTKMTQFFDQVILRPEPEPIDPPPLALSADVDPLPVSSQPGEEPLATHSSEAVIYDTSDTTVRENVTFSDAEAGFSYDLDDFVDPTRMMQDSDDTDLGNFFSRPLKIFEGEWPIGLTYSADFNPWQLFFENPRVINRISNFHLLRSKMRLKILVNGTPFHYGRAMAAYSPLANFDETPPITGLIQQDIVQMSQRPHIFLNPTVSEGGEMELPFFWHKNYLSIPDADWRNMGTMLIRTINNLEHANDGTTPVTISVFAWATDVSVSIPTSAEPLGLVPQAKQSNIPKGKKKPKTQMKGKSKPKNSISAPREHTEANTSGMISGPATAIANAAGALKVIPILTPYATAAEFAADKAAGIAKLFGYSRPAVTKDAEPFKPLPNSELATTTVPDNPHKLTVDDQQSLTIDPRIAGVGNEDSLTIKGIAGRETYLTTFNWSTSNGPESLLWNSRIDPCLWAESGTAQREAFHIPACCMAALPFRYWTGSMKFRFQVVKSQYHKGRLKVAYDPNYFASNEYNTNYLEVIDITEKDDFTITIGNGQDQTLLEHLNPGEDGVTEGYSTTPYAVKGKGNGTLGLYVVNKLTAPSDVTGTTISVNVFISMGDDFEVFVPEHRFMNFVPYAQPPPPRGELVPQADEQDMSPKAIEGSDGANIPIEPEECELGPTLQYEDTISKVWTGESIQSFRPLLRRYMLWSAIGNADSVETITYGRMPGFPYYRGFAPDGVDTTGAGQDYNYCNTLHIHWVTLAHAGWRGSVRYKFLNRGETSHATLNVQRYTAGSFGNNYQLSATSPQTFPNVRSMRKAATKDNTFAGNDLDMAYLGWQGQAYATDKINPNLEFEMPFYHKYRFIPGKVLSYVGARENIEGYDYRIFSNTSQSAHWDIQVAAGEDFQLYFWTGLPRMYWEPAPPA